MSAGLYWAARAALVVGWLAIAVAIRRRRLPGGLWRGVAAAALLFASLRAVRWNIGLLELGRELLRASGVYDDRMVLKVALATLLALAVGAALACLLRVRASERRVALLAVALQCALLGVETFSIGEAYLAFATTQPGRYLAEGAFLAGVAWSVRRGRAPTEAT